MLNTLAYTAVIDAALPGVASLVMGNDDAAAAGKVGAVAAGTTGTRAGARRELDPDGALVAEARAGDLDAFEALVRRYQTRVVNYALAMLRDRGEAEDVAQETFIRAYRSLRRFRRESAFKTWLYTIATNAARSAMERRGRRQRVGERSLDDGEQALGVDDLPSGQPDAETVLLTRDAIDRALAALPDTLRVAVVLRDVEGLDYKEIAEVIGAPIGTVESRIFRARQRLRELLGPLRVAAAPGSERERR